MSYYGDDYYYYGDYSDDTYTYFGGDFEESSTKGEFAMLWLGLVLLLLTLVLSFFAKWNRRGKRDWLSAIILPTAALSFILVFCLYAAQIIIAEKGETVSIYFQITYIFANAFGNIAELLLTALLILTVLDVVTYRYGKNTGWKIPLMVLWIILAILTIPDFALYTAWLAKYMIAHGSPFGTQRYSNYPGSSAEDNYQDYLYLNFGLGIVEFLISLIAIGGTVASISGGKGGVVIFVLLASIIFFGRQLMNLIGVIIYAFRYQLNDIDYTTVMNINIAVSVIYYLFTGIVMVVLALVGLANRKHERNPPPQHFQHQHQQQQQYAPPMQYQQQPYPQQYNNGGYAAVPAPAPYQPYQQPQQFVYSKETSRVTSPAPEHQELNGHSA